MLFQIKISHNSLTTTNSSNTNISKNSENIDTSTVSSAEHEEVTQTVIPDKDDLDELTVAPVNELPPVKVHKKEKESVDSEPIDVFIKKLKKESRPIEIKKLINRACTALLVLLIAIPVLLLVYIIVTFIK